jgi:hypothetical protein
MLEFGFVSRSVLVLNGYHKTSYNSGSQSVIRGSQRVTASKNSQEGTESA